MLTHRLPGTTSRLILLALLILTGACSTPVQTPEPVEIPQAITIVDGLGRSVTLSGKASRIVSLAPSTTEILFALGQGDRVVGRDSFSDYPEAALQIVDIGGGFTELNLELILAQKPDLIMASSLTSDEQIQALENAGLTVFAVENPKDFPGVYQNLQTVARLTGSEAAAETLIADMQTRVAAVEAVVAGISDRPLVFYEIDGTDPSAIWAPGPGSFIDTMIQMAGGDNLSATSGDEWVQISLEELIARDPDLILLGDATWGGVTVEGVTQRVGWDSLSAVKNGRVFPFDDNLVSRPGPRLVEGLEALAKQFHPELFPK